MAPPFVLRGIDVHRGREPERGSPEAPTLPSLLTPDSAPVAPLDPIEEAAKTIAERGFAKFLADTEYVSELAKLTHDEFRIPPAITRLVMSGVLPIALKRGDNGRSLAQCNRCCDRSEASEADAGC